jgi:chromosome segregation ATPase
MGTANIPVRLEVRLPGSRPSFHEVNAAEFLIGSVAGCDLIIPGSELPPVLGVICRTDDGIRLRRLAPNLKLTVNGKATQHAPLANGDIIGVGSAEIHIHMSAPMTASSLPATKPWTFNIPLGDSMPIMNRPLDRPSAAPKLQHDQQSRDTAVLQQSAVNDSASNVASWAEREVQLERELQAARQHRLAEESSRAPSPSRLIELEQRQHELEDRERQLANDRAAVDTDVRGYRDDLARFDRQRANLEARELELATRAKYVEETYPLLDAKSRQIELAEVQIRQDQERNRLNQSEIEVARANAAQRLADAERQEAVLRTLEDRLERSRLDMAKQTQELAEQKARQDARERDQFLRQQQLESRHAELALREETTSREGKQLDERRQAIESTTAEVYRIRDQVVARANELNAQEQKTAVERTTLDDAVRVHREDLARLDRFREALENREKLVQIKANEVEQQARQVTVDLRAAEDKHGQAALAEQRLREEEDRVRQLKADLESNTNQLAERAATTESQQSILVAVKAKLERLREELRVEAQALADQRSRHEVLERAFIEKQQAHDHQATLLHNAHDEHSQALQALEQRNNALEATQAQLDSQRQKLSADETDLAKRIAAAEAGAAENIEQAQLLRTKAGQLLELQRRIEADQNTLVEREAALHDGDRARQELHSQLLQRAEELSAKHQTADELAKQLALKSSNLDRDRQKVDADLNMTRHDLDVRSAEMQSLAKDLQAREESCLRLTERIKEAGKSLAMERKQRHESKMRWEDEHRRAAEDLVHMRAELDRFKTEVQTQAAAVQTSLPELEVRGVAALDRLVQARDQLKNHVAELHDYARQSYEDLESMRNQVISETERLREQQAGLAKARNDHRHTVTAFRQQLIDWQGKISEMKAGAVAGGAVLQRNAMDADAVEIEAAGMHLATQVADLKESHDENLPPITDMRDWFRHKLKELAQSSSRSQQSVGTSQESLILPGQFGITVPSSDGAKRTVDVGHDNVLTFTQELDPGDKKLGRLLQSLELADEKTLNALLHEARRQRRSLRQVLLASGRLTVYQMAMIEAGNLDGLTIGPLGVIDRLHVTPHESVYRVIDPRSGSLKGPVVLRHLSEAAHADSPKADEFRQCFKRLADLHHPHIAATIEVLDLNGRPAALQEWLTGLQASEWPSLAAVPGVWFRLTCQSLLGLATAHQAGLVHGNMSPSSAVLTSDGLVKLTGIGEPTWLSGAKPHATPMDDLLALGRLATEWAAISPKRKLAKPPRPLPNAVREVLDRWVAGSFENANQVLDALDKAGSQVPAGSETWDRLMKYAGANATDGVAWRKSA